MDSKKGLMERRFKQQGSLIERKPSAQAWNRLESKLNKDRGGKLRKLTPAWLAAACLVIAVMSLPFLLNESARSNSITAFHPSFTIEDIDYTATSTSNLSVHELSKAYNRLNIQ